MPTIMTYKGKSLTDLSREELLEAAQWAYQALWEERDAHRASMEMEQLLSRSLKGFK